MTHTECKDCELSNGDCRHHFRMDGITNYDIASLSACDRYGNCMFFKSKETPNTSGTCSMGDRTGERRMIISDLLDKQVRGIFTDDKVLKGDLIALDAKDGRILFDTSKNKREYIEKFKTGEVLSIWADLRHRGLGEWNGYYVPVIKCYVSHDSWKEEEE